MLIRRTGWQLGRCQRLSARGRSVTAQLLEHPLWCLKRQQWRRILKRDHRMTHWSRRIPRKYPRSGVVPGRTRQEASLDADVWLLRVMKNPPSGCPWNLLRDRAFEWQLPIVPCRLLYGETSERFQDGKNSQRQLLLDQGGIPGLRAGSHDGQVPPPLRWEGGVIPLETLRCMPSRTSWTKRRLYHLACFHSPRGGAG